MSTVRKLARMIAVLWMVGVVAIGVGGAYASRNQDEIAEGALGLVGIDVEDIKARKPEKHAERAVRREAAKFEGEGWGEATVPGQDETSDWGN